MIKKDHVVSQGREKTLEQAISEYLQWMKATGYAESGLKAYEKILKRFLCFVREKEIALDPENEKYRVVNVSDPGRIFHTYDKWECYKAGFYATTNLTIVSNFRTFIISVSNTP